MNLRMQPGDIAIVTHILRFLIRTLIKDIFWNDLEIPLARYISHIIINLLVNEK